MRRLIWGLVSGFNPLNRMRRQVPPVQRYDPMQRYDAVRARFDAESG